MMGTGLATAMAAIVGLSLSVFHTQETVPVQPDTAQSTGQAVLPAVAQADEKAAVQAEPAATPESYVVMGDLKMSDQLGQQTPAE